MLGHIAIALVTLCCFGTQQQPALDDDYKIQGEYVGEVQARGESMKVALQVVALGNGKFQAKAFRGGLPGEGEAEPRYKEIGEADFDKEANELRFINELSKEILVIKPDGIAQSSKDGTANGQLKRVVRKSPTLGKTPPDNAVVLFGDGVDASEMKKNFAGEWQFKGKPARISDEGLLMEGASSKQKFQSHRIHIEFRLPYQPDQRGQKRGNSGIYLQGRYEVQMLDSFGLEGKDNECGGVYKISKPKLNMCYPPMQWQTYDIEFHAAEFEGDQVSKNAWMTVKHNGVTIHDKLELPRSTTASPMKVGAEPGPVYLQNHGNPVRYRNIWVEPIE